MKAAIIGATGYGGAELIRILHQHPEVQIASIHSTSRQGNPAYASYPHLQDVLCLDFDDIATEHIMGTADVVFTATPSGVSSKLIPGLMKTDAKVIDLSGDFRIKNPESYEMWYKKPASDPQLVNDAVYGLSEWYQADIQQARLVANPGCYATAALLGLAPLIQKGWVDPASVIIDAKSGVSGAGRTQSAVAHFPEMNDNFKIYKVNQHQHIPEIEQVLSRWGGQMPPITFSTHLVPMTRGIMATIYANVAKETSLKQLYELYHQVYDNNYFVRLREHNFPGTKEVYGSNFCDIALAFDERTNRITIVSVIDNIMKGASGQAVQNMNIMFGLCEKTGLEFLPVYP
ncbi:N-acetyl-gamma-glutamyl-phosphate reductase [Virgibacillus halophilus]|uniref:N-acetyl-gamma-glutamyl-phosphate reductase n=1 Tax=Tigheibacillus halophilus TaxID=361280 RepID=A0ABU5C9Y6_9BACI|nr:N-acetyl-gamma-glutamyl-phosphate reductase [Virgibacillus halophilus]